MLCILTINTYVYWQYTGSIIVSISEKRLGTGSLNYMPGGTPALPSASILSAVASATVPRPPHTAGLGIPHETTSADVKLRERGAQEGALPGTGLSLPRMAGGPRERRVSKIFGDVLLPGFFSCPLF